MSSTPPPARSCSFHGEGDRFSARRLVLQGILSTSLCCSHTHASRGRARPQLPGRRAPVCRRTQAGPPDRVGYKSTCFGCYPRGALLRRSDGSQAAAAEEWGRGARRGAHERRLRGAEGRPLPKSAARLARSRDRNVSASNSAFCAIRSLVSASASSASTASGQRDDPDDCLAGTGAAHASLVWRPPRMSRAPRCFPRVRTLLLQRVR